MASELKRDEPVHCVEQMTGSNLTGTLELGTDSLHAEIYSYADTFSLREEGPLHLRTAQNHYVSLYNNIVESGETWTKGPPEVVAYRCDIISNCAVVGPRFWEPSDRVRRVHFQVPHADAILRNSAYRAKLGTRAQPRALLAVTSGDTTLNIWYSATYGLDFKTPKTYWPTVELEFAHGIPLEAVMERVYDVVELFALSLWTSLRPDGLRISDMTTTEVHAAVETETYLGDHAVEVVWHDKEVDRSRVWAGASPIAAYDSAALKNTQACLSAWLDRRDAWKKANAMMMQVLARQGEVSADRLIAACRWLEEIPQAAPPAALPKNHLEAVAAAASGKAEELGHADLLARITGALRVLARETHEARFTRLLASLGPTFGLKRFVNEAVPYLVMAQRMRGAAAHGHFAHEGDKVFRDLNGAITATEALCALLTAAGLPLDQQAYERTRSHRALEAFLLAYK